MKVSTPPLYLLPCLRSRGDSPTALARRFYAHEVWRQKSLLERLTLVGSLLAWPVVTGWNVFKYTRRNGAAIQALSGRSSVAQAFDQLKLGALYGLTSREYYGFELFRDDHRRQASFYLSRHETGGELIRIVERREGRGAEGPSTDKERFAAQCHAANLPAIPIFLVASHGTLRSPTGVPAATGEPELPRVDLFFKPLRSSIRSLDPRNPLSAERWDYLGDQGYRGAQGQILSAGKLLDHARARAAVADYLIQPRLANHPGMADLSNGALCSVTIQTFLNEQQEPEVVAAVLHLAVGGNSLADNVSHGGLVAAIDTAGGTLGPATDSGKGPDGRWFDAHPDTGGRITGRRLPLWSEALDLARRAHGVFSERIVVGWDMALTPDGPLLIEGDPRGFVTMKQRAYRKPFGETRYGELLAHHIRQLSAAPR